MRYNLRSRSVPKYTGAVGTPIDLDAEQDVVMAEIVPDAEVLQSFNIPNMRYRLPPVVEMIGDAYSSSALFVQEQHDCILSRLEGWDFQCFKCFAKGIPDIAANWQYKTPQQQYQMMASARGEIISSQLREEVQSAPEVIAITNLEEDHPFEEFLNQANEALTKEGRGR